MFVLLSACHPPEETLSAEARALLWDFQESHERGNYTRALALLGSILEFAPAIPGGRASGARLRPPVWA